MAKDCPEVTKKPGARVIKRGTDLEPDDGAMNEDSESW